MESQPASAVSADTPDWSREHKTFWAWDPARSLLAAIRAYQRHRNSRTPWSSLLRRLAVFRHRFWSVVTGADIPLNCRIAGGLVLPHPNGVVVHPDAIVGPNCMLLQQATLGVGHGGAPVLEGHVDVGAGARILGGVRIGRHARIGANAVVLIDVPAEATAIGVPASIRPAPRT